MTEFKRREPDGATEGRGFDRLAMLTLAIAGVVRFMFLDRVAIEHFDEGVYSSDFWFIPATGQRYPLQLLFAPPLFPWLQQQCMELLGISVTSVFGVSLFAGWLTVYFTWWFSRRWFGSMTGLVAVLFAATCDMQILFSRTALTDPLHLLFFLVAVGASVEFLRLPSGHWKWMFLAGATGGLAFATKYTGWLIGPVFLGAGVLVRSRAGNPSSTWPRLVIGFVVGLGVASLVWSPVWRELQIIGGYQAVQENHATYYLGVANWWNGLVYQLGYHRRTESWLAVAGALAAISVCVLGSGGSTWNKSNGSRSSFSRVAIVSGLGMATIWPGPSLVLMVLTLVGILMLLNDLRLQQAPQIGLVAMALWAMGMLIAVPAYTPYPRLSLLWLPPVWIIASVAVTRLCDGTLFGQNAVAGTTARLPVWSPGAFALGACVVIGLVLPSNLDRGSLAWQSRTGTQAAVAQTVDTLKLGMGQGGGDPVVQTLGEPAAMFHLLTLEAAGVPAPELNSWLRTPSNQLLMVGAHLSIDDRKRLDQAENAGQITRLSEVPLALSELQVWNLRSGLGQEGQRMESKQLIVFQHRVQDGNGN